MNIFRKQPLDTVTTFYIVKPTHLQAHLLFFQRLNQLKKNQKSLQANPPRQTLRKDKLQPMKNNEGITAR
jgi:hypothetical protein